MLECSPQDRLELVTQGLPGRARTRGEQPFGRCIELNHTATTVNGKHRVSRHAVGSREQAVAKHLLLEREFKQQPLLDECCGRGHGEERVRLDFLPVSRHIDHSENLTTHWMADRRAGADPSLPGLNIVLGSDDLDSASFGQRRADPVGTCSLLVPAPAGA